MSNSEKIVNTIMEKNILDRNETLLTHDLITYFLIEFNAEHEHHSQSNERKHPKNPMETAFKITKNTMEKRNGCALVPNPHIEGRIANIVLLKCRENSVGLVMVKK